MEYEMRAIAFGSDGFSGDSPFDTGVPLNANGEESFDELLKLWATEIVTEYGLDDDSDGDPIALAKEEMEELPIGFWILEKSSMDIVSMVSNEFGPNSDGETYRLNRACKKLCNKLCSKIIGDSSPLE